ncbi:hypothetical protein M434DRAFT_16730 [Hypoxylon sp. CO27-5]|nr:hypothetical protein M434DRAFT_16730 [Hypoxylon sp. CO27-5]
MSHSHDASIIEYNLRRSPSEYESPLSWLELFMGWMEAELKDRQYWADFDLVWQTRKISEYTVSVANHAYITSTINTQEIPPPRMKHRDIIVDNYRAAGGDLATLQKIGISFITNSAAFKCIEEAFAVREQSFPKIGWCVIELEYRFTYNPLPFFSTLAQTLTPNSERDSPGWLELITDNPFLKGQQKMLHEYRDEFNSATIGRVTVAVHEKPDFIDMHVLYMVTHLTRSDPPPENQARPLLEYFERFLREPTSRAPLSDWQIDRI